MICPQCGAEYRLGYRECADCQIPLEEPGPPSEGIPDLEFEDVKAALDPGAIAVLRSILDDRGIEHTLKGESFLGQYPSVGLLSAPRFNVAKDRADEVRQLVRELQESRPVADGEDEEEPE